MKTAVFYLASGTVDVQHAGTFARSYTRHAPGLPHRLFIIYMNCGAGPSTALTNQLAGLSASTLTLSESMIDLNAYREAIQMVRSDAYCFLNSYATIEASDWLRSMVAVLGTTNAGLVGATGSHQSLRDIDVWTRPALPMIKQARRDVALWREIRRFRRGFPGFPNPHIRTNGFLVTSRTLANVRWPAVRDKTAAMLFESGRHGLSAQVRAAGKLLLVAGRDGRAYTEREWAGSGTFRQADQHNLLIADNQTRAYLAAPAALRSHLEAVAWDGAPVDPAARAADWVYTFGAGLS